MVKKNIVNKIEQTMKPLKRNKLKALILYKTLQKKSSVIKLMKGGSPKLRNTKKKRTIDKVLERDSRDLLATIERDWAVS